jgi:hypothetical protein
MVMTWFLARLYSSDQKDIMVVRLMIQEILVTMIYRHSSHILEERLMREEVASVFPRCLVSMPNCWEDCFKIQP